MVPGSIATIHGFDIPNGMVYVGSFMSAALGGWYADQQSPCLIDPSLKVANRRAVVPTDMGYWPSYSAISPEHRLNYLTWLSTGKCDTSYPVGYAFLYFYGLERRLLLDNPKPDEESRLVAEVERLRTLYASSGPFSSYSRALLELVALRHLTREKEGLESWKPDLMSITRGSFLPLLLHIKLALHAVSGVPVDWKHATAAMLAMSPYQGGPPSSIGMSRTKREFIELVRQRFVRQFPRGYLLRDRKDSTLQLGYHAATQNLSVIVRIEGIKRLPDPTALTWTKISELCAKAAADLHGYAKLVGKGRQQAHTLAAAMALPPELADLGVTEPFKSWLSGLPSPVAQVPLATLGHWCFGEGKEATGAKQARGISIMLASVGYGMEPDPTYGGEKPGAQVLLFRLPSSVPAAAPVSPSFRLAALAASVLAAAHPPPDAARVVSELVLRQRLSYAEAIRLAARHRLMLGRMLAPGKLKVLVAPLPQADRESVADLAAATAATCGEVSPATITGLERLFEYCGVDRRKLYAILHEGAAATASGAQEPIVVAPSRRIGGRYKIPQPSKVKSPAGAGVAIDMERVAAILGETQQVNEVLAPIYQDEAAVPPAPPPVAQLQNGVGAECRFADLDSAYAALLSVLCSQAAWSRAEFEVKARELGLLPDGAIENINEWAFDALDATLIEDGDPLTINIALLSEGSEKAA